MIGLSMPNDDFLAFIFLDRINRIFRISFPVFLPGWEKDPESACGGGRRHKNSRRQRWRQNRLEHGDCRPGPFRFSSGEAKKNHVRHARRRLAGPILYPVNPVDPV